MLIVSNNDKSRIDEIDLSMFNKVKDCLKKNNSSFS